MAEITKQTPIGELVKDHPETVEVFLKFGLHCIGCPVSMMETIEQGAAGHGMSDEEIDNLVKELNEKIKEKSEE